MIWEIDKHDSCKTCKEIGKKSNIDVEYRKPSESFLLIFLLLPYSVIINSVCQVEYHKKILYIK